MNALTLDDVTVSYGGRRAVDHLSLEIPRGALYGVVGPNGAGKTTALAVAVGMRRPDSGTVHVHGVNLWREQVRAKRLIGVLPDGLALPEQLTGREALRYLGMLRGLDARIVEQRSAGLLAVLGLAAEQGKLIAEYSTGMRKKIGLALALLRRPRLLVLDEPLEAVDPMSALTARAILRRFVAGGGTVLISSHVMPLVEQLCDHVTMINEGRLVAQGRITEVLGTRSLEDVFAGRLGAPAPCLGELDRL